MRQEGEIPLSLPAKSGQLNLLLLTLLHHEWHLCARLLGRHGAHFLRYDAGQLHRGHAFLCPFSQGARAQISA